MLISGLVKPAVLELLALTEHVGVRLVGAPLGQHDLPGDRLLLIADRSHLPHAAEDLVVIT